MRFSPILCCALFSVLPSVTLASPVEFNLTTNSSNVNKRATFDDVRMTFYDISVGITACGEIYSNNDFVVALNSEQFGSGFPGPNCFKNIQLEANGITVTAQIVDNCPGCPFGGLDVTSGLFAQFADPSVGVITGSWSFA